LSFVEWPIQMTRRLLLSHFVKAKRLPISP
jgi:hypothetical protein